MPRYVVTPEIREKMRQSHLGKKLSKAQRQKISDSLKGRAVSKETREKISSSLRNEKHFNWSVNVTYGIAHYWLRQNFGKPKECEGINCTKKSKTFDWALKKGFEHARNRSHYLRLCRSCHVKYDKRN